MSDYATRVVDDLNADEEKDVLRPADHRRRLQHYLHQHRRLTQLCGPYVID